jgi:hypothetical protein
VVQQPLRSTSVWSKYRRGEANMTESLDEYSLKDQSTDDPGAYMDDIDAMSLEELESRLPQAQEALDAIESKLEELMGLRDAALVCAAAMAARLAALKQSGDRVG